MQCEMYSRFPSPSPPHFGRNDLHDRASNWLRPAGYEFALRLISGSDRRDPCSLFFLFFFCSAFRRKPEPLSSDDSLYHYFVRAREYRANFSRETECRRRVRARVLLALAIRKLYQPRQWRPRHRERFAMRHFSRIYLYATTLIS